MLEAVLTLRQGDFTLDANFRLPDSITALFGPSGSGKSTLLAALAGLKQAQGRVVLNGVPLDAPTHRRGVGLVFQDARLFPHLTVRGNLAYAWKRADPARRREIETVARYFDIADLLDRSVIGLSGGEKARVALARAIVGSSRLLLLDEPFAALDGVRRRAFIAVLRQMHRAFAVPMLVVTHQIDEAAALADHLLVLHDGKVVADGPFADAACNPSFRRLLDVRDTGAAVPGAALVTGGGSTTQHLWLRADQVLLATRRPEAISARNILQGEVVSIIAEASGSHLVEVRTAAGPLLSRLTAAAVDELSLAPGVTAWALVKAHAF